MADEKNGKEMESKKAEKTKEPKAANSKRKANFLKREGKKKAREEKGAKKPERKIVLDRSVDPFETINFVLMTEKCVRMIEAQNKLVFIVRRNSRKQQIRKAVENAFMSPVSGLTTMIDQKGRKRAYIAFSQPGAAGDIAIRLGII